MKVEIITHNGGKYETTVENYDAIQINKDANSPDLNTLVIGDVVVSRYELKLVVPIKEEQQEEPQEPPKEEITEEIQE